LNNENLTCWWEQLKGETYSIQTNKGWKLIPRVCPNLNERIWFVPLENHDDMIYETTPTIASNILGDSPTFEYAIVSRQINWMIIENRHNVLIATGIDAIQLLKQVITTN